MRTSRQYGQELSRVHHDFFGDTARRAAAELIGRLSRAGFKSGTIADLGAGSGILAAGMTEAGYDVWGVDLSEAMLEIARREAPRATFVHGSLWQAELPSCVGVAAIGEAFCYATDRSAGLSALAERFGSIHAALAPGGVLLFDVAGPGRSGPTGRRIASWSFEDVHLELEEIEDAARRRVERTITLLVAENGRYRRVTETHVLRLYDPEAIEILLRDAGFDWERPAGALELRPGWHAYAARKTR